MTAVQPDRPTLIDSQALDELVRSSAVPVLADFYADWCAPCRMMAPILDSFAREHAGQVVVVKVDTDASPQAAITLGIRSIPTLVLFRDGREVDRQVGVASPAYLANMLATSGQ
ncbi:MAG TPA: thioredoxin [Gemmatimonadaceae bacterium]